MLSGTAFPFMTKCLLSNRPVAVSEPTSRSHRTMFTVHRVSPASECAFYLLCSAFKNSHNGLKQIVSNSPTMQCSTTWESGDTRQAKMMRLLLPPRGLFLLQIEGQKTRQIVQSVKHFGKYLWFVILYKSKGLVLNIEWENYILDTISNNPSSAEIMNRLTTLLIER